MAVARVYGCVHSCATYIEDGCLRVYFDINPTSSTHDVAIIVGSLVDMMTMNVGDVIEFELMNQD